MPEGEAMLPLSDGGAEMLTLLLGALLAYRPEGVPEALECIARREPYAAVSWV